MAASTGSAPPVVEATGTGSGLVFCPIHKIPASKDIDLADAGLIWNFEPIGPRVLNERVRTLAKDVPCKAGQLSRNPFKKWSQIDPFLPHADIVVLGASQAHGTRDSLHELLLKVGAARIPALAELRKRDQTHFDNCGRCFAPTGLMSRQEKAFSSRCS